MANAVFIFVVVIHLEHADIRLALDIRLKWRFDLAAKKLVKVKFPEPSMLLDVIGACAQASNASSRVLVQQSLDQVA